MTKYVAVLLISCKSSVQKQLKISNSHLVFLSQWALSYSYNQQKGRLFMG